MSVTIRQLYQPGADSHSDSGQSSAEISFLVSYSDDTSPFAVNFPFAPGLPAYGTQHPIYPNLVARRRSVLNKINEWEAIVSIEYSTPEVLQFDFSAGGQGQFTEWTVETSGVNETKLVRRLQRVNENGDIISPSFPYGPHAYALKNETSTELETHRIRGKFPDGTTEKRLIIGPDDARIAEDFSLPVAIESVVVSREFPPGIIPFTGGLPQIQNAVNDATLNINGKSFAKNCLRMVGYTETFTVVFLEDLGQSAPKVFVRLQFEHNRETFIEDKIDTYTLEGVTYFVETIFDSQPVVTRYLPYRQVDMFAALASIG